MVVGVGSSGISSMWLEDKYYSILFACHHCTWSFVSKGEGAGMATESHPTHSPIADYAAGIIASRTACGPIEVGVGQWTGI